MAKTIVRTKRKKDTIMIDVFAGIDRSTSRYRIEGDGERFYEMLNVFPYIQGLLQRRRDAVQTNSRDSNNAFPTFPTQTVTAANVLEVREFNNTICIFYEDTGDTGKLMMDSLDTGANTLTNRIDKADGITFTAGGPVEARTYHTKNVGIKEVLGFTCAGDSIVRTIRAADWSLSTMPVSGATRGACEVFLQSFHFTTTESDGSSQYKRSAPSLNTTFTTYTLSDGVGEIIKLLSFGYQTSSAGATSVLLIFKPSSIWAQIGIGSTESLEQITGNIGLVGKDAITYTPFGVCFAGRDTDGLINLYLLDRNSLVLHTIGHELYEELNDIPKTSYSSVVLSFHRNRMVRIAMTKTGDPVENNREYWLDFYNGLKKRTLWGPNLLPASNSLAHALGYSGGDAPEDGGFFMLVKESGVYKIYEEADTDTYNSTDSEWDDQVWRTKMYDFGGKYAIIPRIIIVALANGAKFKVYYEVPKTSGDDDDTTKTLIGSYQMGTGGSYESKPIRIVPGILRRQTGFKIESDYDVSDNNPFEMSQFGFEYEMTDREVIE